MNFLLRHLRPLLILLILGACAELPNEPVKSEGVVVGSMYPEGVTLIRLAEDHPPFFNTSVSFWAKSGTDTEGALYFEESPGKRGQSYARFRVRKGSLLAYPDGRLFEKGDSVLITMRILDPTLLLLEMQPSGLRFNTSRPAELQFEYDHADPDYNQDGVINTTDTEIQHQLAVWSQEDSGGPFRRTQSINFERQREILARILSFSRLAVAY